MLVLDTDVLSLLQRGEGREFDRLSSLLAPFHDDVVTTVVSFEEQMRGWLSLISRAERIEAQVVAYHRLLLAHTFLRDRRILPFDGDAADIFGQLRRTYRRLGAMDLKIAAIVLSRKATLLTRNRSDFEPIAGIRLLDLA